MASTSTIMGSTSTKKIKLKSSDGEIFEIDESAALESQTIKHMIEADFVDETGIPLPTVTSKILKKIIDYCKKHADAANSDKWLVDEDGLRTWDAEFVKVDQDTLFGLMSAASYLDIKSLKDLTAKTVAGMMLGKTPEEIRKIFNIKNDYTMTY